MSPDSNLPWNYKDRGEKAMSLDSNLPWNNRDRMNMGIVGDVPPNARGGIVAR